MHIPPTVADEIPSKFKDAQQSILGASLYKFINKFPEHKQIFTDASKSNEEAACAGEVCTPEEKLQVKLLNAFSVQ